VTAGGGFIDWKDWKRCLNTAFWNNFSIVLFLKVRKNSSAIEMSAVKTAIQRWIRKNQFVAFGIPFLTSLAIGSYMLAGNPVLQFNLSGITQIKYDHSDRKTQSQAKHAKLGLDSERKKQTVAELYFDLMKSMIGD
jgi:hypothetical protein